MRSYLLLLVRLLLLLCACDDEVGEEVVDSVVGVNERDVLSPYGFGCWWCRTWWACSGCAAWGITRWGWCGWWCGAMVPGEFRPEIIFGEIRPLDVRVSACIARECMFNAAFTSGRV